MRPRPLVATLLLTGAAINAVPVKSVAASQVRRAELHRVETYDDRLVRVDQMVPGFGGMFIDTDGRLAIYLLDATQLAATRSAIDAVFGSNTLPAQMRALQGQYSVSQLKAWTERSKALLTIDGVTMIDLDEAKNRVTVGVVQESRIETIGRELTSLDIPRAAVLIKVTGTIKPLAPK